MEILSPYPHELNGQATACAGDCPACRWVAEQNFHSALAILSSPDFPQLLRLAIDRAVTRVIAQQDDLVTADEKAEDQTSLVAHSH